MKKLATAFAALFVIALASAGGPTTGHARQAGECPAGATCEPREGCTVSGEPTCETVDGQVYKTCTYLC